MAIYTVNLTAVLLFSALADRYSSRSPVQNLNGQPKPLLWFALFSILSLALVSGLRFMVGTDYVNYAILYDDVRTQMLSVILDQKIEAGYVLLSALFGLFTETPFAFIFFVSLITHSLIILALRDYSRTFWLSCALYILTFYFFAAMNMMRQAIAVSVVFYAHRYMSEKRFGRYVLFILGASLFHASALIMIPVYFFVNRPAWSWPIWAGFGLTAVFYATFDSLVGILFQLLSSTRYSVYGDIMGQSGQGANILRVAVAAMPVALAFLFRKRIREKFPESDTVVNMAALALMVAVMTYKQIYFGRISLYFSIYNLLLLPYLAGVFADRRLRTLATVLILFCYGAYCYVLLPTEGGVLPYQSIFSAPSGWNVMDYIG